MSSTSSSGRRRVRTAGSSRSPSSRPGSASRSSVRSSGARAGPPWRSCSAGAREHHSEDHDMKFGIFYEHQIPRPWGAGGEHRLFKEALDQVEFADRLGIDYAWEVEHHFLEEYSHSSAPEVFLAACSQRTKHIRLGHGITLMPPGYNHPARVAERIATLDLVSDGRVEWGTGESSSRMEMEGYGVDYMEKREAWEEAVRECAKMMCMEPYPGYDGKY